MQLQNPFLCTIGRTKDQSGLARISVPSLRAKTLKFNVFGCMFVGYANLLLHLCTVRVILVLGWVGLSSYAASN